MGVYLYNAGYFGGAFFASFPLFYSTSFGGAYWVWMLILLCFVIQAVSYEYQAKKGTYWAKDLPDIPDHQRCVGPDPAGNCRRDILQRS